MTWLRRYRVRRFIRDSIWIFPALAIVLAIISVRLLHALELRFGWTEAVNPDTMRSVLGSLAGSMFTFIIFVGSSLLLVVQLASAQLTPRVIGVLFRDSVTKLILAAFVFTFTFTMSTLIRTGESIPLLTANVAAYGSAACVGLFLYLIDRVGRLLRPSGALGTVAFEAHQVIESVYPIRFKDAPEKTPETTGVEPSRDAYIVTSPSAGVVLAFDVSGLVALATRCNCTIEMIPQVGELVAPGSPLFRVVGAQKPDVDVLRESVALGIERTVEQDPTFAFRVIVDIASKGLSPAINDPTTAVLAIDRIHYLLSHVGNRCLDTARVRDASGALRLIYRTPDWEDFVTLAVTEIRQFGGASIQIARRLRAMLEDLIQTLPEERAVPLRHELKLLQRTASRFFLEPEDLALAEISDSRGVGGKQASGSGRKAMEQRP